MTVKELKDCCACKGVGTALCWAALSNAIIIATALLVLGFGEIWFAAYAAGADIALLMKALNHSSQSQTLRYIGIEREDIADVYIDRVRFKNMFLQRNTSAYKSS